MAGKKLPKDIDFAAGFFSTPSSEKDEKSLVEKIVAPTPIASESPSKEENNETKKANKNPGGRPKKIGLKNEQFTLTMNPEIYEKLKIVANDRTRGNFSALIDDAIKSYCKEKKINLSEIEVPSHILDTYRIKQEKRAKRKTTVR